MEAVDIFTYNVHKTANNEVFNRVCSTIETKVNKVKKDMLLEDVDGTTIQKYKTESGEVKVYNDYEIDAVYVDSEIDLSGIF